MHHMAEISHDLLNSMPSRRISCYSRVSFSGFWASLFAGAMHRTGLITPPKRMKTRRRTGPMCSLAEIFHDLPNSMASRRISCHSRVSCLWRDSCSEISILRCKTDNIPNLGTPYYDNLHNARSSRENLKETSSTWFCSSLRCLIFQFRAQILYCWSRY